MSKIRQPNSASRPAVSRREFLRDSAALGGALIIGFHLPEALAQTPNAPPELNAWIIVHPDDRIVIRYARAEMGQGSLTAAAQLVAEELGADWNQVSVEYVSTNEHLRRNRVWGDMASVGSQTIRGSQQYLREAGARAREMLVAAAAERWGVPAAQCTAGSSTVTHTATRRELSYGALAAAAARQKPSEKPALKEPAQWSIAGRSVPRLDIPATVSGRQRYASDIELPGMLHAAIAQCPVFGGKVKGYDASSVQTRRGVKRVLSIDDGKAVAVVADNSWRAQQALKALAIQWDEGRSAAVSSESILANLHAGFAAAPAPVAKTQGDVDAALAGAAKVLEAEYFTPYQAHATMEPQTCTALLKDGRLDLWAPTQMADVAHMAAAQTAGVPPEQVTLHRVQLGGGFGRRGGTDFVRQAVLIARELTGTPVKLQWSREEDMQHDYYRPANVIRLKAGLDDKGDVVALKARLASQSLLATLRGPLPPGAVDPTAIGGFGDLPFAIPNVHVEFALREAHVPVGFWRAVAASQNPFAREGFVDEIAQATGRDPLELRRTLLREAPRDLAILDATCKAADYGKPLPAGVFRGIAEAESYGSYSACVAELSVDARNAIKLHRLVVGLDCGHIVHPDNVIAQIQGSVVWALSALFWGEITLKDGRVQQSNFNDYRLMTLAEMPRVETVLAPSGGFWGGVGEPAVAAVGPAVCNAIAAATGKRLRSHPLSGMGYSLKV